jgi:hypothetical protein
MSYTIPALTDSIDGSEIPGTDAIESVDATVTCVQLNQSYDATLRFLLENLGDPRWYFDDVEYSEGLISALLSVTANWKAPVEP